MGASRAHLVFFPTPGVGRHLVPAAEIANLLVERDDRLSVTFLVVNPPRKSEANPFAELLASVSSTVNSRIRFLELPWIEVPSIPSSQPLHQSIGERFKPQVRAAVAGLAQDTGAPPLAGIVIDMFCTPIIDVADEFGVPSYLFFTCSAAFLGFLFHVQALQDEEGKDLSEFNGSDAELEISTLVNPVPAKVFPTVVIDEEQRAPFLGYAKRFRKTKGIMVNSFEELEAYSVKALSADDKIPPVYPVGPILNLKGTGSDKNSEILRWLDDQPRLSVVFLCFGSHGSFQEDQVKEMARGIENSGQRFLWSLRRAPPKVVMGSCPEEYENPAEVLPEGFLERTAGRGKVIGWAPQVEVLAHQSVGGFVTHCGWNSTLESLWYGVPTAAWPMYAEQQFNAFAMVLEHEMAVEVKMDYRKELATATAEVVGAEAVERAIRKLMEVDDGDQRRRKEKVRDMSERSRKALEVGGSSHSAIGRFIGEVFDIIQRRPSASESC